VFSKVRRDHGWDGGEHLHLNNGAVKSSASRPRLSEQGRESTWTEELRPVVRSRSFVAEAGFGTC
jgi:hypothetical protein